MQILSFTITNWRSIVHTHLEYNNLLILIGGINSGKSSLLSALSFFLNPCFECEPNLRDKNKNFEIASSFIHKNGVKSKLSISKKPNNPKIYYTLFHRNKKKDLTQEEFSDLLENVTLFEISSSSEIPQHHAQLFVGNLINFLEKNYTLESTGHLFLNELYSEILNQHVNKPVSRYIIFKSIRYLYHFLSTHQVEKIQRLFIFLENPELFLNPQEQRELFDYLIKLSNMGVNIILETHSNRFVGLEQYRAITIAKAQKGESSFFQYRGNLFSGDELKNFNMNYWINTDRSELFFAKKVILVEGQTDKMVINYLGKNLNLFKYEYTIIECGSKSLIPQFIKLCNSFKIPFIAVYDKDNHLWRNEIELDNSSKKNHQIQKIIDYSIGNFIEFDNDIEEEIFLRHNKVKPHGKNKPFIALTTIMEDDFVPPLTLVNKLKKIWN